MDNVLVKGTLQINNVVAGPGAPLCRNASFKVSTCDSSSRRYKKDVSDFGAGIETVKRLRPVSFVWKSDNSTDLGFIAEEVAAIEPSLIFRNPKNEIEGVRYDRVSVVLVNAFNEQQTQIERQNAQIERQQAMIDGLRKLLCEQNQKADICK